MALWREWTTAVMLAAVAGAAVGAQSMGAPQHPQIQSTVPGEASGRFRSAVDLVSVAAVVKDRRGRFVPDLAARDFSVAESGEQRPIVGFRAEDDGPVRLAIVFDVSGSMQIGSKAANARDAARLLLAGLGAKDQAALFSFDTRLERVCDFTSDFGALMESLGKVDTPYGQTSLYDAVAQTARALAASRSTEGRAPQRAAVVVLTDGVDTNSRLKPEQVSAIASEIDVPVYVMAVMASIDDPRQFDDPDAAAAGGLRDLARWTGGELYTMSAPAHTSSAAREIVSELRHQYLLAFEASPRPGWRSLEIKARNRNRDLTVRARSGYTAGSSRQTSMNVSPRD